MRKLSTLITLLVLGTLVWGGYWFVGAEATKRSTTAWLDARRGEGWTAEAKVTTAGFPNRFDTTFEAVEISDPGTGVAWSAPWFQTLSLSYKPTEVFAVWPPEQELRLPTEVLGIASEKMVGSFALGVTPSLPLERLVLELDAAEVVSSLGWTAQAEAGQIALRETPDAAEGVPVYDLAVSLDGFVPQSREIARLRRLADLPERVETVAAELTIIFDKGWDLTALEDRRPQPREITLSKLEAAWGDVALLGHGEVSVDADGVGTGNLALEVTNWRDLLTLAKASGALPEAQVPLVTRALEALASLSGDPNRLEVPLRLANGFVSVGPVPIGPAPLFVMP